MNKKIPPPRLVIPNQSEIQNIGTDCDCACEPMAFVPVQVFLQSAFWKIWDIQSILSLSNEEYIVVFAQGPVSAMIANTSALQVLHAFDLPVTVQTAFSKVEGITWQDFYQIVGTLLRTGLLHSDSFVLPDKPQVISAWLHVTDRCNLRCAYCYLPHVREDMSLETGRAAIDAVFRSALAHGFRSVKLKYAGGEPLLRFSLILELHRYAQGLAEQYGFGLEGVVLSNGTLITAGKIRAFLSLGLRLMISLDGLGSHHNKHRVYISGRGSFSDVIEGVEIAQAEGLVPHISITVSSRTVEGLPEIMAWVLAHNLPFSLNFYRENELSASHEDMRLDEQKIISGMLAAFKVIEDNLLAT